MQIEIQSHGFIPFGGLGEYIQQRLVYGLGRVARRVGGVVVQLTEERRARHGNDMRCRIHVRLEPAMEVVVVEARSEMYAAIEHAAARVVRAVSRSLRRSRKVQQPIGGTGNVDQSPQYGEQLK